MEVKRITNSHGVEEDYTQDRHGYWRNSRGWLAPGQKLHRRGVARKEAIRAVVEKGAAALRDDILKRMPEVLEVLYDMAIVERDLGAIKILTDKALPSLKQVETEHTGKLPTLIVNMGSMPSGQSAGTAQVVDDQGAGGEAAQEFAGGTPTFQYVDDPAGSNAHNLDNFSSSREILTKDGITACPVEHDIELPGLEVLEEARGLPERVKNRRDGESLDGVYIEPPKHIGR